MYIRGVDGHVLLFWRYLGPQDMGPHLDVGVSEWRFGLQQELKPIMIAMDPSDWRFPHLQRTRFPFVESRTAEVVLDGHIDRRTRIFETPAFDTSPFNDYTSTWLEYCMVVGNLYFGDPPRKPEEIEPFTTGILFDGYVSRYEIYSQVRDVVRFRLSVFVEHFQIRY